MRKALLAIVVVFFTVQLNAQVFGKVYEADNLKEIVAGHKTVAIIPFNYKLTLKKMPKGMTETDIKLQEEKGSISAQNSFYTYALEKQEKKETNVEIQDIARTKVLLARDSISEKNINNYLPEELCKKLGVDAIISGELLLRSRNRKVLPLLLPYWLDFQKQTRQRRR